MPFVRSGWYLAACVGFAAAAAGSPIDDAVSLFRTRRYSEARAALEPLAEANPPNPAACYFLGLTLLRGGDPAALDGAAAWLEKAVRLKPSDASYLADYGDACLSLASRRNSFVMAVRGRDALEKAVALDPGDLATREGLVRFYGEAPFPLGDPGRARAQAAAIGARNPLRGAEALVALGRIFEKKGERPQARSAYAAALQFDPGSRAAITALARLGPS